MLLIAIFATLVTAGCWDNRRTLQRVLDEGYPTIVEITGAQFQRAAPFALDGWRPRFVEQSLSVNVKWNSKDGKPHEFQKVPVTEQFAATLVDGQQVKLAILPAKVLDDEQAVPVINADAVARFASLQEWIRGSAIVAGLAWVVFGAITLLLARAGRPGRGVPMLPSAFVAAFPPRRTLFGLAALLVGGIVTYHSWSVEDALSSQASDGVETTAEITSAMGSGGNASPHAVQLSWKDAVGGVHHYGPVRVSDAYWNKITRDGVLAVHEARIRYVGQGIDSRPTLVDDKPAVTWRVSLGFAMGVLLGLVGVGCLVSALRIVRKRSDEHSVK